LRASAPRLRLRRGGRAAALSRPGLPAHRPLGRRLPANSGSPPHAASAGRRGAQRGGAQQDARHRLQRRRSATLELLRLLRLLRRKRLHRSALDQRPSLWPSGARGDARRTDAPPPTPEQTMSLVLVEAATLFTAAATTVFLWGSPHLLDWIDAASFLGQAAALSLCCIVAFYYNDLYDLRVVRSFAEFATRLLQGLGVALLLLAGFYTLFPDMRVGDGALVPSLLFIVGLLLPIRAVGYAVMRRRAFADRVLILGTGELARKLVEEIGARPRCRA